MIDLSPMGGAVRALRQARGLTIARLAETSGLSTRFISDLERGRGNISIARLAAVAAALDASLTELVAPLDAQAAARPWALVGLRGAGKSTVGTMLAGRLGIPFVELDQKIESAAGLPLSQIFEIHGEAYYRRLEREVLRELLVEKVRPMVLAVGGGVVTDDDSWQVLLRHAETVWLKAKPEQHYRRVMEQGDLRPMRNRPAAMAELRALLADRTPRYSECARTIDTARLEPEEVVARLVKLEAA